MAALQTPPPGTPKTISGTQTFNPPSLDGLMQPKATTLIFNGGHGQQPSEAGPIRTHTRQAAKERPSPVVFDGKEERERERERTIIANVCRSKNSLYCSMFMFFYR